MTGKHARNAHGHARTHTKHTFALTGHMCAQHDSVQLPIGALHYSIQESAHFKESQEADFDEKAAQELAVRQMELLTAAHLTDLSSVAFQHTGELEASAMALLRVLVLQTPDEAAAVTNPCHAQVDMVEERARDVAQLLSLLALEELPTSFDQDLEVLSRKGREKVMAVQYRMAQKQILLRASAFYSTRPELKHTQ